MMAKGGDIQYKCRRCGEVYTRDHALDLVHALQCAVFDFMQQPREWGIRVQAVDIHPCAAGAWGVADIVGGQEDAETKE